MFHPGMTGKLPTFIRLAWSFSKYVYPGFILHSTLYLNISSLLNQDIDWYHPVPE